MSAVTIRIGSHHIQVERVVFWKWFPVLASRYHHVPISADELIQEVKVRLNGHTSIPTHSGEVIKAVCALLEQLRWEYGHQYESKGELIIQMMDHLLRSERSSANFLGLYRSRRRFLILCMVARCTQSDHLARALGSFFESNTSRIVEYEDAVYLREWCLGLFELRGLLHDYELRELMDSVTNRVGVVDEAPFYDHYSEMMKRAVVAAQRRPMFNCRRGWPELTLPALSGWVPRGVVVPAMRRCRSLDHLRIGWHEYSRSAWPSPKMSLAEIPRIDYLDKWEQKMQAIKVEDLRQRVRRLEYKS
jgi:hypothetical protein